jgi:hypothetical protein
MSQQQVEIVELQMAAAQKAIDLRNALERLKSLPDFKKVIEEGYFTDESRRAVLFRSDPDALGEIEQKDVENIITSIGGLYQYFRKVYVMAQMAEKAISDDQETREELLTEDLVEEL